MHWNAHKTIRRAMHLAPRTPCAARAAPLSHSVVPAAVPESDTPRATRHRGARKRRGAERGAGRGARAHSSSHHSSRHFSTAAILLKYFCCVSSSSESAPRGFSLSCKVKTQPCKQVLPPRPTPLCRGRGCAERSADRSRAARGAQRRGSERASPTCSPTPAPLVSSATLQTCCLHHTAATRTAPPAAVSSASRGRSARARTPAECQTCCSLRLLGCRHTRVGTRAPVTRIRSIADRHIRRDAAGAWVRRGGAEPLGAFRGRRVCLPRPLRPAATRAAELLPALVESTARPCA
jgi:hypothetical protein